MCLLMQPKKTFYFVLSFFFLVIFVFPLPALAKRYALILGNNEAGFGKAPLRYAERDADQIFEVLTEIGSFSANRVRLLKGRDAITVLEELEKIKKQIKKERKKFKGDTLFVFYYSGHADTDVFYLNSSKLPVKKLKDAVKDMPAKVKIAILDACHSGEITQTKGGQKVAPFEVVVDDHLKSEGEVFISSSTAIEPSLESEELAASFFTHYLISGLRGGADKNNDSRVSLFEAYKYAYDKTVYHSSKAIGASVQHPSFQFAIKGKGEIILTELNEKTSYLAFGPEVKGKVIIYDKTNGFAVAELTKKEGVGQKIAVAQGRYLLKNKVGTKLYQKEVTLGFRQDLEVDFKEIRPVQAHQANLKQRTRRLEYSTPNLNASKGQTGGVFLQEGQLIKVRLLENISSKTSFTGEKIHFEIAADVFVNDQLVLKKGAKVLGEVVHVDAARGGKKGQLKITFRYAYAKNGQIIPLKSVYAKKGLGGKQKEARYIRGTEFDVFVESTVQLVDLN